MPRKARQKDPNAVYHIMCRSESEFLLFRDDGDKEYYLGLLKRYNEKYKCNLCAYCLMDNHLHLHLNPQKMDISTYMLSLNTAYVRYYNKKYNRHGHVFQGRFESKIINTDEYNFALTAYIHNNPKDIEEYKGREEDYPYSSYGIYLNKRKDTENLIDQSYIRSIFETKNNDFEKRYFEFVSHQRDIGTIKSIVDKLKIRKENEYVSGVNRIIRGQNPSKVISYIASKLMAKKDTDLKTKSNQNSIGFRSFTAYVLRVLCGLSYKEICNHMCNITISGCARLCSKGYELINTSQKYEGIFDILASNQI